MSDAPVGRRGLLRGLIRPAAVPAQAPSQAASQAASSAQRPVPAPARFSLEAFYAARERPAGDARIPPVPMRPGLPAVETTAVGVCPPIEHLDLEVLIAATREDVEGVS